MRSVFRSGNKLAILAEPGVVHRSHFIFERRLRTAFSHADVLTKSSGWMDLEQI